MNVESCDPLMELITNIFLHSFDLSDLYNV